MEVGQGPNWGCSGKVPGYLSFSSFPAFPLLGWGWQVCNARQPPHLSLSSIVSSQPHDLLRPFGLLFANPHTPLCSVVHSSGDVHVWILLDKNSITGHWLRDWRGHICSSSFMWETKQTLCDEKHGTVRLYVKYQRWIRRQGNVRDRFRVQRLSLQ
jgi:hypothetical protein